MFGEGTEQLLEALPDLGELDSLTTRRLLSGAWLEVVEMSELASIEPSGTLSASNLRRLAVSLQVYVVLNPSVNSETVRACAFVAAESLSIANELNDGEPERHIESLISGVLYLIAGFDANARVVASGLDFDGTSDAELYGLVSVAALLGATSSPDRPDLHDAGVPLYERVHNALMLRLGDLVLGFNRWLRDPSAPPVAAAEGLEELASAIRLTEEDLPLAAHGDVQHLARLTAVALHEASTRALRNVAKPEDNGERFTQFLQKRCPKQPLLWPAAADYSERALPGPSSNAVVTVPTGAGKSAVADLAIQHALTRGWILYLAPTNALTGQIRRQLIADHPNVDVTEYLGGAEYTQTFGEVIEDVSAGRILVMTPEKCSLALRQSPEIFASLSLMIFDEAHNLGDQKGRGGLFELVVAEVIFRAENAAILLMSALIANPETLEKWLNEVQDRASIVVKDSWRPTRTMRAVVGIDRDRTLGAAREPLEHLAALPPHRKNVSFDAPLAVLASLQGPWSTDDSDDYSLLPIAASTPMSVRRDDERLYIREDSPRVRPTVEALSQLLGEKGEKVMSFMSRSRHDCFAAATGLDGFGETALDPVVEALLGLAAAELGVETLLAATLHKGVGVHTSALINEERRASELAFAEGDARVLFATGTLAQGLNLPATTVIVGGTRIGYSEDQNSPEVLSQQRSQLLNAIGRAGRARVAVRSLALVVPNELPLLEVDTLASGILSRADFLAEEDASTAVTSALRPLLSRIQDDAVDPHGLWNTDQVALSYLAPTASDSDATSILGRTWGAHQLALVDEIESISAAIGQLGRNVQDANSGPAWTGEAARRAGVPIAPAAVFSRHIVNVLDGGLSPKTVDDWLSVLVSCLLEVAPEDLGLVLDKEGFRSTAMQNLWSEIPDDRQLAREALETTLSLWLDGQPLSVVGGAAHGTGPIGGPERGERDPLPRTIRLVNSGIGFALTRAAGLVAAVLDVAIDEESIVFDDQASLLELQRLPLALRFGAGAPVPRALLRAGARPRAVAHLLAERLEPPADGLDDDALRNWARDQLANLANSFEALELDDAELQLVAQFLTAREAR